jgi:hypothetical protein
MRRSCVKLLSGPVPGRPSWLQYASRALVVTSNSAPKFLPNGAITPPPNCGFHCLAMDG